MNKMESDTPRGKKKIKICFVASVDITLKFLLLSHLKFLMTKGYDVYAVCSSGKLVEVLGKDGIKIKTIKIKRKVFSPLSDLSSLFQLFLYFKKEKFDVVFTFTPKPGLLGQLAAKMAGTPIIFNNIFGYYFHEKTPYFQRKFFIFIEKVAAKCSDFIFFRNREDFITAKEEKISKDALNKYVGDGIDISKFSTERFSQDFIQSKKEKLGIRLGVPVIGIVARLVKEKGYLELFESFKNILIKFPNVLLLIVGPADSYKKDSINLDVVKGSGIEKNVIFLGEREDVDELYSLMDIFVLPSHREGFSHSVMEASAMSKPVIASDIRGCRGAIEPGLTGILVPPKNSQKLSEAIIYLLSNPDKARQMGAEGRKKAEKEFDEKLIFEKIFERIEEEYGKIVPEKISLAQKKICHVTTVDITARFILLDFLKFLKKEECEVTIVCSFSKWGQLLQEQGFFTKNIKMTRRITPLADLISFIKLFLYFKKEKFDIVHTYTPKAGVFGRIAARLAGVPIVIHTSYGFYIGVQIPPTAKRLIVFAEKVASHFCDLVFSQNTEDIEWAVSKKVVNPKKIKLLTYGINVERFDPAKFGQDFILNKEKELGIENKKMIGMVGRFVKEKGYLDLFNAFKIIKRDIPDVILLLVAPKDKEKADALDESILKEHGIEKDVVFLGYNKEMANVEEIYSLMDVFVLPSYREGLSMSLLEAQAMKKPVVATDIRGCRESVENGKTGVLVPVADPHRLAEAIISFLSDPVKSAKVGEMGRDRVVKNFDERVIFDKIKEEYKNLLNKKIK